MKTEITRYVAVGADAARSICLFQRMGLVLVNDGPSTTPKTSKRFVWGAWAVVENANGVIGGMALSIVTFTGNRGNTWLLELDSDVQGSGNLVKLRKAMPVEYGVGVMIRTGALTAGDIVQVGCCYD